MSYFKGFLFSNRNDRQLHTHWYPTWNRGVISLAQLRYLISQFYECLLQNLAGLPVWVQHTYTSCFHAKLTVLCVHRRFNFFLRKVNESSSNMTHNFPTGSNEKNFSFSIAKRKKSETFRSEVTLLIKWEIY